MGNESIGGRKPGKILGGVFWVAGVAALATGLWGWALLALVAGAVLFFASRTKHPVVRAAPTLSHESQERMLRLQPNAEDREKLPENHP